jgi:hypothetical protein
LFFEEVTPGDTFTLPPTTITADMRKMHIDLYGEDWPDETLSDPLDRGVVPASLVISIVVGQMGRLNFLSMKFMKEFYLRCYHSIFVDDTINSKIKITEVRPHKDLNKDYGYVFFDQEILNQHETLCFLRKVCYLVFRKP